MKTKIISILALVGLMFNANAESPIWASYKVECPADSEVYLGIISTRASVFTGTVQAVQADNLKIVANGEPNWAVNKFVYSSTQTERYYLKFTSGVLNGAWFDITANDAYSLTLQAGASELASAVAGDSFVIVPHWTLSTLFPNGAGFTASTGRVSSINGATVLYKFTSYDNAEGVIYPIGINRAYNKVYFYRNNTSRGDIGWRESAGTVIDASNDVVEPNTFFKIQQVLGASATAVFSATVPMSATTLEVFLTQNESGTYTDQDIFVVVPSASDITLASLTDSLVTNGLFEGSKRSMVDKIYLYDNVETAKNRAASRVLYYSINAAKWLESTESGNVEADNLKLTAGSVLRIVKKSKNAEFAKRSNFKPEYVK